MRAWSALAQQFQIDHDVLAAHRGGLVARFCRLGGWAIVATGAVHLLQGNWAMATLNASVSLLLLGNASRLQTGRAPLVPFELLAALLIAAIVTSTWLQGMPGLVWSYPMLFLLFFALPHRRALVFCGLQVVLVCGVAQATLGTGLALRVLFSLVFVLLMILMVLRLIGQLQQTLLVQAITDPLTGCYNRRHLQTQLDGLSRPAHAAAAPGPVLLAIDIDHFKRINDRHGHARGDEVLKDLVRLIAARQRLGDLLFRTGGEEFMLLLPRTPLADARHLAETLRQRVAGSALLGDEALTVSIGVSALAARADVQDWLRAADAALYEAKRRGRDCVVVAGEAGAASGLQPEQPQAVG